MTFQDNKKADITSVQSKEENGFLRKAKAVGNFIVDHPFESLEIAFVAVKGTGKVISFVKRMRSRGASSYTPQEAQPSTSNKSDILSEINEIVEKATRSSGENDVPAHRQRYHTRSGVEWRNKDPYHRGGDKG